jgi:hypothetical protein
MEIKLDIFFDTATTNGWWEFFRFSCSGAGQSVDCAEADKKTMQAMRYEWWGFFMAGDCPAELPVIY